MKYSHRIPFSTLGGHIYPPETPRSAAGWPEYEEPSAKPGTEERYGANMVVSGKLRIRPSFRASWQQRMRLLTPGEFLRIIIMERYNPLYQHFQDVLTPVCDAQLSCEPQSRLAIEFCAELKSMSAMTTRQGSRVFGSDESQSEIHTF